jgi:putative nucleotidyltransferase with HDIG domain
MQTAPTLTARSRIDSSSPYRPALRDAIKAFEWVPALEDSKARVMAALSRTHPSVGEAVAVIETDLGLTTAVLRAANAEQPSDHTRIASVPAAVDALGSGALHALVNRWPTFRPLGSQSLPLHSLSTHLNATRLAGDAIARAVGHDARHELRALALLHDIGKLVLAHAWSTYAQRLNAGAGTPEERLALERRLLGLDHASVGALVIDRWGLPRGVATIVARHHAEDAEERGALVRLADMLAHHSHGHPVGEEALVRAAVRIGLERRALRRLMFELPRAPSGRLPEPSPLTPMQAKVLRMLSQSKKYKVIAAELGLSESTVRSHAHALFATLDVADRAQAVLLASERGWL